MAQNAISLAYAHRHGVDFAAASGHQAHPLRPRSLQESLDGRLRLSRPFLLFLVLVAVVLCAWVLLAVEVARRQEEGRFQGAELAIVQLPSVGMRRSQGLFELPKAAVLRAHAIGED